MKYAEFMNSKRSIIRSISKKLFVVLLFAFSVGGSKTAEAQAQLSVGANGRIFNLDTLVSFNDTNTYYIWIKNTGNVGFLNTVYINVGIDSTQTGNFFQYFFSVDSLTLQIAVGDSVPYLQTVNYFPGGAYRMGGNIVVIWPSSTMANTLDSTRDTTVYISGFSSVHEQLGYGNILLYPNPTSDKIFFRNNNNALNIERIRLLDISGRVLKEWENRSVISLEEFAAGVYLLHIDLPDKTSHTFKIIRRE